jgi:CheY-like chemotaxis protein/nitrogen-specific signal transduction histidine kinase
MLVAHLVSGAITHCQQTATLERLQREAVAANEAKSAFLAMMSHEIRTPMNGVLGMAHALAQTALSDEQRRQIDMLTRSGDGMMTILNDILDLSKIEAGGLMLEATVFDLPDVVNGVQALWCGPAREKGLELTCEIAPAVPHWVMGDPTRVRQILINHVSNAVKFTESGSVAIRVRAGDDGQVVISVRDTGIGLTAAEQERLFQAFSQADASITRRFGGTGLGLFISKQLVSLMGGRIEVESAPGVGTEFRIVLRLPAASAPPAQAARAEVELGRLRILVAEDNRINQAVVQAVLGAIDAEVDLADDGAQALRMLAAAPYDLVLMDIHMPNMDGIEALRRLRAGEAGPPDQPVIALTADAMAGDAERFIALGFDAVESKPIQPARLIAAIGEVLEAAARATDNAATAADRAA